MLAALRMLERAIAPADGGMSAELAQHVLSWNFPPEDHARVDVLSEKAERGTLSPEETAELDDYLTADHLLTILKAKARASLKQHIPAA